MSVNLEDLFPNLRPGNYEITSQADTRYNCVAWAIGDSSAWWENLPAGGYYWPAAAESSETVAGWIQVFVLSGYSACESGDPEPGFEKVAIYVNDTGEPAHVARQLISGRWTSKLGGFQDITHHSLEAIEMPDYGRASVFLKRNRPVGLSANVASRQSPTNVTATARLRFMLRDLFTFLRRVRRGR